nr:hypothetical protein [Tanacetum cinerariifolium]
NNGDDFVHPNFSTHDEEAKHEESFDPIFQTPSYVEKSNDEGNDDASHGMNDGGDEGPDAEDDDNEFYGDLNINLDGKEPESTNALKEKTFMTFGKSTEGTKSYQKTTSESAPAEKPMHITQDLEELAHQEFETGATDDQPIAKASQHLECNLAKKADSRTSFDELMDTPVNFLAFVKNQLKVDTLTPELLAGDLMRLHIQDIKDLLLLLVQGKLTNLTVKERFAFNFSLRVFIRSIAIQRHVEDLQLDNNGDDFVHPKFSTHDEEAKHEESFDPIFQTPSYVEKSNDEGNDDASHGMNDGGDEGPDAEDDDNEFYEDLNINLDGRDV